MIPARAATAVLLLLAVVVQSVLLTPLPGPTPDIVLLVVMGVALASGANAGAVTGFAAGLLSALAPPSVAPVGLACVGYTIVGYFVGSRAGGEDLSRAELAGLAAVAGGATGTVELLLAPLWSHGAVGDPLAGATAVALQAGACALLAMVVTPAVSTAVSALPGRT